MNDIYESWTPRQKSALDRALARLTNKEDEPFTDKQRLDFIASSNQDFCQLYLPGNVTNGSENAREAIDCCMIAHRKDLK